MPELTEGQQTLQKLAEQQQLMMMSNAHMQFVTCITCNPTPTKMPLEVRRYMWQKLGQTRKLFEPQSKEEVAFYEQSTE